MVRQLERQARITKNISFIVISPTVVWLCLPEANSKSGREKGREREKSKPQENLGLGKNFTMTIMTARPS